jgi:hypothetical protein
MDDYVNNILKLAAKPGCISILHFITHSEPTIDPLRHQRSGWAWPRKAVTELFKPLHLVNEIHFQDVQKGPHSLSSYYMVFQTPAA